MKKYVRCSRIFTLFMGVLLFYLLIPLSAQASEVMIEDPNLEQAIRNQISKPSGSITIEDMGNISHLVARNQKIQSLKGLEYATKMISLYLENNKLEDIQPLSQLTKLEYLWLEGNSIKDVTPIASLAQLDTLFIDKNQIEDPSPLQSLSQLTTLSMNENQISSIDSLKTLKKLTSLAITDNKVESLEAIPEFESLGWIYLDNNNIKDISPLVNAQNLKTLNIINNKIDFNEVANKAALQALQEKGVYIHGESDQRVPVVPPQLPPKVVDTPTSYTFPIAFNRATKDDIRHIATNNKGTIMTTSWNYVNITYDYGKTWVARKLPRDANYNFLYHNNLFYLSVSDYKGTENYYSKDGKVWTSFFLNAPNGSKLSINEIQMVGGKQVLLATNERLPLNTYVYTSANGMSWDYQGAIATKGATLVWNGKQYTALGGGYSYYGKPSTKNQFLVKPGDGVTGELIIFTSPDLKKWTQHSGAIKKLMYTWSDGDGPSKNYGVYLEQPMVNGQIQLFDDYSHTLTSTDGITFKMKETNKALQTNDWRSPIYENNKQYYVFMHYWVSSGVVNTKVLISKDKIKWKTTNIKALNNMIVFQSGTKFFGYSGSSVAISDDGIQWKTIK
ncbi:leucine-rich repeat domain-containing protein [Paenibacillus alvei]|uniref:leucine-rich repeat domain-containing protein n=1 Tax=Paenibacillus alvei TaxID=44250 RepID=UPI0022832E05|nr:leucine-rich repeat domain-containing protein [Paenibacillus alvei]